MSTETYVVTALPFTTRHDLGPDGDDESFQVSLFVSPRLEPTGGRSTLQDFPLLRTWGQRVRRAYVELRDQDGVIECLPLTSRVEQGRWSRIFPPTTPVRGPETPDWPDADWRSFDAHRVSELARLLHLTTAMTSPTGPPPLLGSLFFPNARPQGDGGIRGGLDRVPTLEEAERVETQLLDALDEVATADLSAWDDLGTGLAGHGLSVGGQGGIAQALLQVRMHLHRARRFYERPESARAYQASPDPDAASPVVRAPEPEFHARCSALADHPALMRRLGLVLDLRVDGERLSRAEWLSASIALEGSASACRSPRTAVQLLSDGTMVARDTSGDYHHGLLALGSDQYKVVDLDADGAAIKADQFLAGLARGVVSALRGTDVRAATPALRTQGLTVVRTGGARETRSRVERQRDLAAAIGHAPGSILLHAQDVTRGLRAEVYDDATHRWYSLHRRRTTLRSGQATLLRDEPEEGFLQGTAATRTPGVDDSPVYVHEAVFGWEGWSLSAPRPGLRMRHADGEEVLESEAAARTLDRKAATPHPFEATHRVEPGTLPRLRFGRSYAFRAWAVDLAGNSRPHGLGPAGGAEASPVVAALVADWVSAHAAQAGVTAAASGELRTLATAAVAGAAVVEPAEEAVEREEIGGLRLDATQLEQARVAVADAVDRIAAQRGSATPGWGSVAAAAAGQASRGSDRVREVMRRAIERQDAPLVAESAITDVGRVGAMVEAHLGGLGAVVDGDGDAVAEATRTVTTLRPFLRWEPVEPPVVVPRRRYTEGESQRVLVVRSGVEQDPDTLAITVSSPAEYAAAHPEYHDRSERHLAPPKTSQLMAELHGRFDAAIGSEVDADQRHMLGWALTESGTLDDEDRADPEAPGSRLAQPGVSLVTQSPVPQSEPKTLPLGAGEPPAAGQYVVHDVDELALPYLPDPMAHGISVRFPEAELPLLIPAFAVEGFTAAYRGAWPQVQPFRLELVDGERLRGEVTGRTMRMELPPGDRQRLRLSSSLDRESLALLAGWRQLPDLARTSGTAEAARDGHLWHLTPADDVTLVHAVPRPVRAPEASASALRVPGRSECALIGVVDLDGASTAQLTCEASWSEPVDELTWTRWKERPFQAVAFTVQVDPRERLAVLGVKEGLLGVTADLVSFGHIGVHQLPDTRARRIRYRFRAATRFREYFPRALLAGSGDHDRDGSVVGPEVEVVVPSSARPAPPIVHSVVPAFRWTAETGAEQPMGVTRQRHAAVRIHLERPWFSSGEGELLGVILAPHGNDAAASPDGSGYPFVSKIGLDPVWEDDESLLRPLPAAALDTRFGAGHSSAADAARPVRRARLSLPDPTVPKVDVLGYRPEYDEARGLWYVDVAIDLPWHFWPFLRLAVCRYQPDSLPGLELSEPARCDFVQVPPARALSVSRTDERSIRAMLIGSVRTRPGGTPPWAQLFDGSIAGGLVAEAAAAPGSVEDRADLYESRHLANRSVLLTLQRRIPGMEGDLGWQTVEVTPMRLRTLPPSDPATRPRVAAWWGELTAPDDIALRRPPLDDEPGRWRVRVEEWESFPADPPVGDPTLLVLPATERRLVYADEVPL